MYKNIYVFFNNNFYPNIRYESDWSFKGEQMERFSGMGIFYKYYFLLRIVH